MTETSAEVFLTGASGFVGSHVLDALLGAGYSVRALVRPESRPRIEGPGVSVVYGDLQAPGEIIRHLNGCRYLVHTAALYSFSPSQRSMAQRVNVQGTKGLLEAARIAGVERAVVTSSSATVGPAHEKRPATEENWAQEEDTAPGYHQSKMQQERAALAARVPAVLVLPSMPVGPNDWKPTPTGKTIVDFMRGRIFASLGGGVNVVAVEDVARAHVQALQRGRPRERYLIGGENISLDRLWQQLAELTGRPVPTRHIPYSFALALGWADELRGRVVKRGQPLVPVEGVHMARHNMWISPEKAKRELGFEPTPVRDALARAVEWYRQHGYAH